MTTMDNLTLREVILNNKSRKGIYYYLKLPGKHGAYYKKAHVPLDVYIRHYTGQSTLNINQLIRVATGQTIRTADKKTLAQYERYLKNVTGKKTRQDITGSNTIEYNLKQLTLGGVKGYTNKLLKPLVASKAFLPVLRKNSKQFKHHMTHTITIWGRSPQGDHVKLATIQDLGNRDLKQLRYDYNDKHAYLFKPGTKLGYSWPATVSNRLGLPMTNITKNTEGTITDVSVQTRYTSGQAKLT